MPPKKGAGNRRGAARREEILDAAVELFATRGYRGSGILELAERVGISHVGVLHHFGTKEELLREVVAKRDHLQADVLGHMHGKGLDALAYIGESSQPFIEPALLTRLTTVLLAENLDPDGPLHDYFDMRQMTARSLLANEIRRAQERGDVRADVDADLKAAEILALIIGVQIQWLLNPDLIDADRIFASYIGTLVDDLRQPPTGRRPRRPRG